MSRIVLTAADGMVYTNGTDGGKVIYLAEGETGEGWYEVPEDEYIRAFEGGVPVGQISDSEALAILMGGGANEAE